MKDWKFVLHTIIRVLIILVLCVVFGFIFAKSDLFFSQIIIFSLVLLLSFELIRFVTRTNKELKKLLSAIKHHDFSANFSSKHLGKSYEDLAEIFTEIIKSFRKVKIEKEAQYKYFKYILEHVNLGIMSIKKEDLYKQHSEAEILFLNKAACTILQIPLHKYWHRLNHQDNPI